MWIFYLVSILAFLLNHAACRGDVLPTMYAMDDYEQCRRTQGTFCVFQFFIFPNNQSSKLSMAIQDSKQDPFKVDRSLLSRMFCVSDGSDPADYGLQRAGQEIEDATLHLLYTDCDRPLYPPYVPIVCWVVLGGYVSYIMHCTWKHYKGSKELNSNAKSRWYRAFSLIENWRQLTEVKQTADFRRLGSLQGVRVFNTVIMLFTHTAMSLFLMYVRDVEELEKSMRQPVYIYLISLGAFCVQFFFMASSFLLTNQICEIHKKHDGAFTLRHCYVLMLNRIFRIVPALLVMIVLSQSGFYDHSPHTIQFRNTCVTACQRTWWYTLMQITYLIEHKDMCIPVFWYISVDTLFYMATMAILYFVHRLRLKIGKVVGVILVVTTLCLLIRNYLNDCCAVQLFAKALNDFLDVEGVDNIYIKPLANWPASLIGVLFGWAYFKSKSLKTVKITLRTQLLWWLAFVLLPLLILQLSTIDFRVTSIKVFMATFSRPLFVFPLVLGIFGMSLGLGGIVRSFLETRFLVTVANVTYCTYVFHSLIVFAKGLFLTQPLGFKSHHLLYWTIFDVIGSFLLGTVFTLLVEYPGLNVRSMYLPKIADIKSSKRNQQ